MVKATDEFGLLIDRKNEHGTEYVTVHVVRREVGREAPLGCGSDVEMFYDCPAHLKGLAVDGLGMYGFVSESIDIDFIGYEVEFRNVFAMGERKLAGMLKALKRVNARIQKDEAREAGDKFVAFAKALKLSFSVTRKGERRHNVTPEWQFMTIAEGRNRYRQMIEEAVAQRKAAKVA